MNKKLLVLLISLITLFFAACSSDDSASSTESDNKDVAEETVKDVEEDDNDDKQDKDQDDEKTYDEDESKLNKENEDDDVNDIDSDQELEELEAHFIDVGQADAALLEYSDDGEDYNVLIDTGDWNANESVEYLNQEGVDDLDLMVGSHPHADHIGQMDKVIDQVNVDEVWMSGDDATSQVYERVIDAIDSNDIDYEEPSAGDSYDVGPLEIDVVSPDTLNGNLNDDSIVMKATYGKVSFLFTGDAEQNAEEGMLSRDEDLGADILKVGHHGSSTSSTESFVDAVDPEVSIMSVGQDNKYNHPDQGVLSRFEDKGVDLYATKDNGTIVVNTDGEDYDIEANQNSDVTASGSDSESQDDSSSESDSSDNEVSSNEDSGNGDCVDINNADEEELQRIKHIGPERAGDVIDGRPYESVDDLEKVNGIAASRIQDIQDEGIACVN